MWPAAASSTQTKIKCQLVTFRFSSRMALLTGEDLLDHVTEEKLKRLGMPGGPAWRISSALAAINPVEAAMPSSMGE